MEPGTLVRITQHGPLGTLKAPTSSGFANEVVFAGDRGKYWGHHPELDDWHIIEVETLGGTRYCPLHEKAFSTDPK